MGVSQADEVEQARSFGGAAVRAGKPLMQRQHLLGRRPSGETEQLGQVANEASGLTRPCLVPGDARFSTSLADEPAGDLGQRRFAGAVRPEEADDLALANVEVDACQCALRAVALLD
jgi:hypothetical protein